MLLQPLIQRPGLGVEPQSQFNVAVWFQGKETEHFGQVLGTREAEPLVVPQGMSGSRGESVSVCQHLSTWLRWWAMGGTSVHIKVLAKFI